jgi:hypothetical protein
LAHRTRSARRRSRNRDVVSEPAEELGHDRDV